MSEEPVRREKGALTRDVLPDAWHDAFFAVMVGVAIAVLAVMGLNGAQAGSPTGAGGLGPEYIGVALVSGLYFLAAVLLLMKRKSGYIFLMALYTLTAVPLALSRVHVPAACLLILAVSSLLRYRKLR